MPKLTVGNDVYTLQKKHHIFSANVISYLQKYFSCAIKQKMLMRLAQSKYLIFQLFVALKTPKMHHYSKLESLDFDIGSVVCQRTLARLV